MRKPRSSSTMSVQMPMGWLLSCCQSIAGIVPADL
jgi:hypothetical protein